MPARRGPAACLCARLRAPGAVGAVVASRTVVPPGTVVPRCAVVAVTVVREPRPPVARPGRAAALRWPPVVAALAAPVTRPALAVTVASDAGTPLARPAVIESAVVRSPVVGYALEAALPAALAEAGAALEARRTVVPVEARRTVVPVEARPVTVRA